ncbi:maintenance of mitochondrial structure and function-domain-containing protein [Dunaliella salina]|uniref:COP9 signalosome complex subunit 6 n=1 Tax=Dunaliella salina TaxID=3046 RepID=A0ABQ7G022_DUNSA|nr:maintenance of mitochondrial structure and function-domain-containing protein [Dunaliella salina]|eukprot:KAF5827947.1 maintenance of mitochondrial structure and function-domain-containing protein [Dunaliella salina]
MEEPKQSTSSLEFKLHPLCLINVSDHYTRTKANCGGDPSTRVLGVLLGSQSGRVIDISNSFEISWSLGPQGQISIDTGFLQHKMEQYKQVFPRLDVMGWYATGESLQPQHMEVNKVIMAINESPVFLLLNPKVDLARKDLPVSLYETEHVFEGTHKQTFVKSSYTVETSDAERIGVDQVAKITSTGKATGSEQLSAHLSGLHSAIKMLVQRVRLVQEVVSNMRLGSLPYHDALLRKVSSLVASLPTMDTEQFHSDYLMELNDALLCLALATMTRGVAGCNDAVDKVMLAYDKAGGRRKTAMM